MIRIHFGSRITKANDSGTAFPVFGGGGESFRTDSWNRENDWVISRFAMSEQCVRFVSGKFWVLDSGFTFDVDPSVVDKAYMGQVLLNMQPVIFETSTQAAQKNIDVAGFRKLPIPLPPVEVQARIARDLAAFCTLVTDLSIGLPAELAARRKQYEHYRDRLLTFTEISPERLTA